MKRVEVGSFFYRATYICPSSRHKIHPGLRTANMTAPALLLCSWIILETEISSWALTCPKDNSRGIMGDCCQELLVWSPSGTTRLVGKLAREDVSVAKAAQPTALKVTTAIVRKDRKAADLQELIMA